MLFLGGEDTCFSLPCHAGSTCEPRWAPPVALPRPCLCLLWPPWLASVWDSLAVGVCLATVVYSQGCRRCQGSWPPLWLPRPAAAPHCPVQSWAAPSHRPAASGVPWEVPWDRGGKVPWRWHCCGRLLPLKEDSRRPAPAR